MKKFFFSVCLSLTLICSNTFAQNKGFEKTIEINAGTGLDDCINYTFGMNFIGGYRVNQSFFIGAGIGYSYIDGLYYSSYEYIKKGESLSYESCDVRNNVQAFIRAKLNLKDGNISPFLLFDLGGTLGLSSNDIKMANGLTYEPAFGINFKKNMYVMLGYKGLQYQHKAFDTTYGSSGEEMRKKMAGVFCLHIGFKL